MSLCRASSRARPPLTLDCSTRSVWPADSLIIHFSHNYRRFVVIYICANQPVMCCVYRDKSRARELKTRSRRIDADTLTGSRTSLALSTNNFSYAQPFSPHFSHSRQHTRKELSVFSLNSSNSFEYFIHERRCEQSSLSSERGKCWNRSRWDFDIRFLLPLAVHYFSIFCHRARALLILCCSRCFNELFTCTRARHSTEQAVLWR